MVEKAAADVHLVAFACEAGMGSSLIGVNQLKKRLKEAGLPVTVLHTPVNAIPAEADVVIVHAGLAERARKAAPQAVVLSFNNFLKNTASEQLLRQLTSGQPVSSETSGA
jgi:mannitol-specific phosphotransferase system IIBC component